MDHTSRLPRHPGHWARLASLIAMTGLLAVGATSPAGATPDPAFPVSGSVTGLAPGASVPLVVSITNPFGISIVVQRVGAVASDASPLCTTDFLVIEGTRGELLIPPGKTATDALVASLTPSAPDACQGAVFPLSYDGRAVEAVPTPGPAPTALAVTGTSAIPPVVVALVLLFLGTTIVAANRRRRARIATAP